LLLLAQRHVLELSAMVCQLEILDDPGLNLGRSKIKQLLDLVDWNIDRIHYSRLWQLLPLLSSGRLFCID
jgi:hypothetical protein